MLSVVLALRDTVSIAILNQLRECLFPTPYSLLPTPCSQIRCSLFPLL
ncbi:hypothetical protein [Moorena sp. SIO3I6]|nr:hypothetical protein [Moorena sp. SIO3I6]NEP25398.1 hypothetical protein [Moorena sp. SIO3I6]